MNPSRRAFLRGLAASSAAVAVVPAALLEALDDPEIRRELEGHRVTVIDYGRRSAADFDRVGSKVIISREGDFESSWTWNWSPDGNYAVPRFGTDAAGMERIRIHVLGALARIG